MRAEAGRGRARAVGAPAARPPRTVAAPSGKGAYAYLWVLPALALVLLFTLYPVAHTLWTSLHRVMILLPGEPFVGLANYQAVLESAFFAPALLNSLWFTLVAAPLIVLLGLGVAHLLLADFRGRFLVRSVVILPWALPGAISAVIWIWIFHPSWGILNLLLYEAGLIDRYLPWLTDPPLVRVSVVVAHVWTQFPFAAVLLMAALTAIDPQLYEAAKIDGAGHWQRFRFVTFPQIKAMVVVLLVYGALVAFTSYDLVYAMTGGGPGTATTLLSFHIWKESFSMYNFGNGAALAFITVLISLGFIFAIVKALPSDLFGDPDA
ncbi:MAG TPA: sugar ABC transporter permease [Geminicoccaceae bacterium]|nr:sugar ABC transporter permease [Geminicoccaceae bacterium]